MLRKPSIVLLLSLLLSWPRPVTSAPFTPSRAAGSSTAVVVGSPLPLACPDDPPLAICLHGYVYYDGVPVAGGSVAVQTVNGSLTVSTAAGGLSSQPYFHADLTAAPLLATAGDTLTLTASYHGSQITRVLAAPAHPSQVDLVLAANDTFGSGADGDLTVTTSFVANTIRTALSGSAPSGQAVVPVVDVTGFQPGQEVLLIQMQDFSAGTHEFGRIAGIGAGTLELEHALSNSYTAGGGSKAQVMVVPNYHNLTIQSGGALAAPDWDGAIGGVLAVRVSGSADVSGQLLADGAGYSGGAGGATNDHGLQGTSYLQTGIRTVSPNSGGGGGGQDDFGSCPGDGKCTGSGGGGAGYGTGGVDGQGSGTQARPVGQAGGTYGGADLSVGLYLGSGGGGGGSDDSANAPGGAGGDGGGIILFFAHILTVNGTVTANGVNGQTLVGSDDASRSGGGGGGSGGSIMLTGANLQLGSTLVTALGGAGAPGNSNKGAPFGGRGGDGGLGRIRLRYASVSGETNPSPSAQLLTFPTQPIPTLNGVWPPTAIAGSDEIVFEGSAASPRLDGTAITAYAWRSDVDGALSTSASFTRTAASLTVGTHTIYFKAMDSHNEWSEEISRTLTVQAPVVFTLNLPVLLRLAGAGFVGTSEIEPNNAIGQANGPLLSGVDYQGFQNDGSDYFSFYAGAGAISVNLANTAVPGTQLYLYYQSTANLVGHDGHIGNPPYQIGISGPAGWYYIRITAGAPYNSSSPYTLRVTYP